MGNMLDMFKGKLTTPPGTASGKAPEKAKGSISVYSVGPIARPIPQQPAQDSALPRAAAVYGAASAIFAVLTVFYLIKGIWFTGIVLIVPTFCLGGFAYHYMKK